MRILTLTLLLTLLLGLPALAEDDPASTSAYGQGVALFDQGEYSLALEQFLAARDAGQTDRSLRHNIAVCYYKLKQWPEANTAFAALHAEDPYDSLVAYNLAVTEKKLGNTDRAAELFLDVSLTSPSSELALLANRQYERLDRVGDSTDNRKQGDWLANASFNLGNDSNVIDPTDEATTERDDNFAEALVSAAWYSNPELSRAWTVDLLAYSSRYQDVDDYDIDLVSAGAQKYFPLARGHWFLGVEGERSRLGGDDYLGTLGTSIGTGQRYEKGGFWNLKYRFQDLNSLEDEYDPQDGVSHRVEADTGARLGKFGRWKLRYRYDFDDREDFESDERFTSYSAQRHGVMARWIKTGTQWEGLLSADYRFSRFEDDNTRAGEVIDRREDNRYKLSARLSWFLNKNLSLTADYSFTDSDSNIDRYDYDRHLIMGGINWQL